MNTVVPTKDDVLVSLYCFSPRKDNSAEWTRVAQELAAEGMVTIEGDVTALTQKGSEATCALLKTWDEELANDPEHQEFLRDQEVAACEYNDERRGWGRS